MKDEINNKTRNQIEEDLYRLIEAYIEGEYDMDKFDNLIYKEGGQERAFNNIKAVVFQYAQDNNVDKDVIISILKKSFSSMSKAVEAEQKEIMGILTSLESIIIDEKEREKRRICKTRVL